MLQPRRKRHTNREWEHYYRATAFAQTHCYSLLFHMKTFYLVARERGENRKRATAKKNAYMEKNPSWKRSKMYTHASNGIGKVRHMERESASNGKKNKLYPDRKFIDIRTETCSLRRQTFAQTLEHWKAEDILTCISIMPLTLTCTSFATTDSSLLFICFGHFRRYLPSKDERKKLSATRQQSKWFEQPRQIRMSRKNTTNRLRCRMWPWIWFVGQENTHIKLVRKDKDKPPDVELPWKRIRRIEKCERYCEGRCAKCTHKVKL